jgi:NDP-mannose synthase
MRAVILAGGKGVRLYPITQVIPKPLVPLGERPILEIVIRQLAAQGFRRLTLAVGYMADLIRSYFGDGAKYGVHIDYSYESRPLGTAGPLALIDGLNDTFLMMNADVLTDLDYRALLDFHRAQGGVATVGAFERVVKIDLGVIIQNGCSRIADYVEKPTTSHLVSMGVYVFEPQVLDFIRDFISRPHPETQNQKPTQPPGYLDFPDLIKLLIRDGRQVNYYLFSGYWLDIGRHDDYAKAAQEFESLRSAMGISLA